MRRKSTCLLLLVLLLLSGCYRSKRGDGNNDVCRTDSFISYYKDSMLPAPLAMKYKLLAARNSVTDSICYYKLTVFTAFCCYHNYQNDSARLLYEEVLNYCARQDSALPRLAALEAYAYNYIGIMLQEANRRDSAIHCLHKAYNALMRTEQREKLPDICINLADNYFQSGDFPKATGWYRRALLAADSLQMGEQLNHAIYCGMARIYTDINNFQLADRYYRLAEAYYPQLSPYEKFFYANTRGNYYYITEEYEDALPWFYRANNIACGFKKGVYRAITESNLGEIYLLLEQTDSAQHYLDKASAYFFSGNADASTRFYFDGLYASLALCKNQLGEAKRLLSKSYDADVINPTYIYLHDKRLEELYARQGNYAQAYAYSKQVQQYDDSLRNIKALNNIAEIDSRYRQDTLLLRRDVQIAYSKAEALQFRNISILLTSVLIVFVMTVGLLVIYARRRREQRYAKQMATITRLRMENVRNRISPHFIFNTLNVVIPALRQYDDLVKPLHLLVQSIRNNLLVSEKMTITLEEEIGIVRNFLELKQSIAKEFPEVRWVVDEQVNMQTLIPSMIMQIPVENAIKYAFDSDENDEVNQLSILIRQTDAEVLIDIEDNGNGYMPGRYTDIGKGTGTGLKVLFRTIDLLNMKNQQKIAFKIENLVDTSPELHGTRVTVRIPLNFNYNL